MRFTLQERYFPSRGFKDLPRTRKYYRIPGDFRPSPLLNYLTLSPIIECTKLAVNSRRILSLRVARMSHASKAVCIGHAYTLKVCQRQSINSTRNLYLGKARVTKIENTV